MVSAIELHIKTWKIDRADHRKHWTSQIILLLFWGDPKDILLGTVGLGTVGEVVVPGTHVYAGSRLFESAGNFKGLK